MKVIFLITITLISCVLSEPQPPTYINRPGNSPRIIQQRPPLIGDRHPPLIRPPHFRPDLDAELWERIIKVLLDIIQHHCKEPEHGDGPPPPPVDSQPVLPRPLAPKPALSLPEKPI